ncbi:MAG: hypothetical protein IH870_09940 [Chloroflexi bacterium]|nr:hypothetical protein [Chloroflexota bacterium]
MAQCVGDAAPVLQMHSGHDARDPGSLRDVPPDFTAAVGDQVRILRLAWSPDLGYAAIDPKVKSITALAARVFGEINPWV